MALMRGSAPGAAPATIVPPAPGATTLRVVGEPIEVPAEITRHGGDGRPKIWPAGCTPGDESVPGTYYTRASKLGEVLEDGWAIHRANTRRIVFGFGRSEGLYDRAQAVASLDDKADRAELDVIAELAAVRGGEGDAALSGTALHLLTERADAGDPLEWLSPRLRKALDAWRHLMDGFTVHGTEGFVVNDALLAAGTYDRILSPVGVMVAPDGERITPDDRIGADLKSGKDADHFGPLYKVQQRVYFAEDARPYSQEHGRGDWPDLIPPRADWSLIPHVPIDHPEDAGLYWVDLGEGARLAELAVEVRAARKAKGLAPAECPVRRAAVPDTAPAMTRDGLLELIGAVDGREGAKALRAAHAELWDEQCDTAVRARLAEVAAAVQPPAPTDEQPAVDEQPDDAALTQGEVIGEIRRASSRADLDALFARVKAAGGTFTPYMVSVVRARLAELEPAAVAS